MVATCSRARAVSRRVQSRLRGAKGRAAERTETGGKPDLMPARKMLLKLSGRPWGVYGFSPIKGAQSPQIPP